MLVDAARQAIAEGSPDRAAHIARELSSSLLVQVVNATGVIAHTNLGRSPVEHHQSPRAQNLEFDLATGKRGSRQAGIGRLISRAVGSQDAIVVNNNAAAVMLVLAALADGRDVAVSRGESVEIGGGFRIPEVLEQSGARLVDVGTTNRTRVADYRKAIGKRGNDVALVLKVHPSNYRVDGFVESTSVSDLATLGVTVVADIGSGLVDSKFPWLVDGPPTWLADEPAARQTLEAGADIVTFSTDKLLGGPQAGVIAGRADLVRTCAEHPLMRALRPGGLVLASLHETLLAYLKRDVSQVPFWRMATVSVDVLRRRAEAIVATVERGEVVDCESLPGAGSTPGASIPSVGIRLDGDCTAALRTFEPPVIARVRDDATILDLRTVDPSDDTTIIAALRSLD